MPAPSERFISIKSLRTRRAYMGHAVGHWEGDSLVTDVSSFTPKHGSIRSGDFHGDALHVVERFTPITRDAFRYDATIEDKNVFTRPWKGNPPTRQ